MEPGPLATVTAGLNSSIVTNVPRWVANVSASNGQFTSVFGQQNAQIFDSSLRASVAASRRLTFDVFSQLLYGSIHYDDYQQLATPWEFKPYDYGTSASYDRVSFTVNAVARYEYLPGSFATIVFLHREGLAVSPGQLGYDTGIGLLTQAQPDTTLMAKLTYLFY